MDDNGVLWRLSGLRGPDNVHDVGNLVIGQTRRASQSVFQIASMREAVYGSSVGEQQFDKSHVRTMRCEGKSRLPKFIGRIDICSREISSSPIFKFPSSAASMSKVQENRFESLGLVPASSSHRKETMSPCFISLWSASKVFTFPWGNFIGSQR